MYSILLIALAAVCKAVSDTLIHHWDTSVFKRLPKKWWKYVDPSISHQLPFIRFTRYRPDLWHLSNSGMQLFFLAAVFAYQPTAFGRWIDFFACSVVVIGVFNLFYNRLLLRK